MVGFVVFEEDAEADGEDVALRGEGVHAGGGDYGLAEFAHGHHEGREVFGGMRVRGAGGAVADCGGGRGGGGRGGVEVQGGEAPEELVAAAGLGAEAHVAVDYFGVVALLGLEVEQARRVSARLSKGWLCIF